MQSPDPFQPFRPTQLGFSTGGMPPTNPYQSFGATGSVPGMPPGGKIPNYLVHSILATLCCCLPFGIVAIIYAAQVDGKVRAGDISGALASSQNAKKWCWIAFGVGIVVNIIVAIVQVLAAVAQIKAQGGG